MVWAYPVSEVVFWRQIAADGTKREVPHAAQPWFACQRCKGYIDQDKDQDLADILSLPADYFDRLRQARLPSRGHSWAS